MQGRHIQYIADNVDHNVATIDDTGTFHVMGIIAAITPGTQAPRKPIQKMRATAEEIAKVGRINIEFFKIPPVTPPITYLPLSAHISAEYPTSQLGVMWKTSLLLQFPRPSWSGTMQMLHYGEYPGESSVMFLPMIDLDPSYPSCIYTT